MEVNTFVRALHVHATTRQRRSSSQWTKLKLTVMPQRQLHELDQMDYVKQIATGAFIVINVPMEDHYAVSVLENLHDDWYDYSGYSSADVTADEAEPLEIIYKDRVYWFEHSANFGSGVASMIGKKVGERVQDRSGVHTKYYQEVIDNG